MDRILITGANRGIGLEMVRQLLQSTDAFLIAGCRKPTPAHKLQDLAAAHSDRLVVIPIDVTDVESIDAAVVATRSHVEGLDMLVNNAGIYPKNDSRYLGQLSYDLVAEVLNVNAVSSVIVTQAYLPLLKNGVNPRVVMVSSQMGSIKRASGGAYAYRMSKAAMNMGARILSADAAMTGITTITLHPGWVQTDMGGSSATLTPKEAVTGILKVITGLTPNDNGKFYQWDGQELPW